MTCSQNSHLVKNNIPVRTALFLFLIGLVALTSAFNLANSSLGVSSPSAPPRIATKLAQRRTMLTFADRVAYQRSIEEVYWRHRTWPKERPDPKPSLDAVMSQAQLEKKVADYLRNSKALEDYWQRPLTAEQLQAEMDRMAQHSGQRDVLRELFEALDNDPFVIAECLARPALAERLVTNWYAYDQRFHGVLRQRAEADLRAHHTIEQMKQTSGKYTEIELVRGDNAGDEKNHGAELGVQLNSREWDGSVQKLAAMFGSAIDGKERSSSASITQIKTGILSPLQEDEERYYTVAVVRKDRDRIKLAVVEWHKEPLESWRDRAENQMPNVMAAATGHYALPSIANGANGCTQDTWTVTTNLNAPSKRYLHTAVWTGSEMIIWGGFDISSLLNSGGRYNPSTDTWTTTSTTNAPSARRGHMAIWTGTEMIVWGGGNWDPINTGGRYNPTTDSWTATSTTNAPSGRLGHTLVWTGTKMIVWGGADSIAILNTGGKYDPGTDQWEATRYHQCSLSTVIPLGSVEWQRNDCLGRPG